MSGALSVGARSRRHRLRWRHRADLTGPQISILSLAPFLSTIAAFFLAPMLARGREKRDIAILVVAVAVVGQPLPMLLRLAGLFPAPGSPWLIPLLTLHSVFETFVWVLFSILSASMMADLAEENQRATGRRSEGALFAVRIFAQKAVSGVGVFLSGVVLSWIRFPTNATPGHVPQATLTAFALSYAPVTIILGIASAALLFGYRITRARHAANLEALEKWSH